MFRIRPAGAGPAGEAPPPRGSAGAQGAGAAAFAQALAGARLRGVRQHLDQLLAAIDQAGARLAQEMTLANLRAYRDAVAEFLRTVQHEALAVHTEQGWDSQAWHHRALTIVRKVDEELDQLARQVLEQEHDRLAVLARIGEIRGLLLDLRI